MIAAVFSQWIIHPTHPLHQVRLQGSPWRSIGWIIDQIVAFMRIIDMVE
jgi:hypothetical protein